MKLSFSTLGCPDWDLDTMISRACEWGYDGIDFRGYKGENDIWKQSEFSENIQTTYNLISENGLEVPCFSSSIRLLFPEGSGSVYLSELDEYCRLASLFNTPYIRVFGGYLEKAAITDKAEGAKQAASFLDTLAEKASVSGVSILVETHDDWIAGPDIKLVLEQSRQPNTGLIWDIHHPFRKSNESLK